MNITITENLTQVQKNIAAACVRSSRNPREVTLIAVSKTKPLEAMQEAYRCGVRDFGENKVQEIIKKAPEMPPDTRFHMIGHLQLSLIHIS